MVSTNTLIVGARLSLLAMTVGATFNASTLSTNRHGARAVLIALAGLSGSFAAIVLASLIALAVTVARARDAGVANAVRSRSFTSRITGSPATQS